MVPASRRALYVDQSSSLFNISGGGRLGYVQIFKGVTSLDIIRNEYVRGSAQIRRLGDKVRKSTMRWSGLMHRRGARYVEKEMLELLSERKTRKTKEVDICSEVGHKGNGCGKG